MTEPKKTDVRTDLENELLRQQKKRRLIQAAVCLGFLAAGILCAVVRETTREVIRVGDDVLGGMFTYESIRYAPGWSAAAALGFGGAAISGTILLSDFLFCRFSSVEVNGFCVTAVRTWTRPRIFVDGEAVGDGWGRVVDFRLSDGVKVCAAFYRTPLLLVHLSFSDHHEAIDL